MTLHCYLTFALNMCHFLSEIKKHFSPHVQHFAIHSEDHHTFCASINIYRVPILVKH